MYGFVRTAADTLIRTSRISSDLNPGAYATQTAIGWGFPKPQGSSGFGI